MRRWLGSLVAAGGLLSLAVAPTAQAAGHLTPVTIQIDGGAVPFYAPLYVAAKNGYFRHEGLSVKFLYGDAADIVKNVAAGNVQFGFPNADDVISAYANGIPVRVVNTTYQHGIGALMFLASSGIHSVKDLKGKTIAITSYGSPNYIQLQVMLKHYGMSLADVHLKIIGTGSIVNALLAKQVDAIDFSMIRTYLLRAQGVKVDQILSDDFLPDHGNVLITSAAYLKSHPGTVKAFNVALDQAIRWITAGHELAAVSESQSYAPTPKTNVATVAHILRQVFAGYLWNSPYTRKHGLGYGYLPSWQATINTLAHYKVIPHGFKAAQLVVQPASIR